MFCVPRRQHFLLLWRHIVNNDLAIFPELQFHSIKMPALRMVFPHIVGIHQTRRLIKPPSGRARVLVIANMPLAKHPCCITRRLEHLGNCGKIRIQPPRPGWNCAINLMPARITSRQQRSPRRRTNCLRHIKLVITTPTCCQFFHIGRRIRRLSKWPKICPSGII